MNQSCDQGPNQTPCMVLWGNLQHLTNTSTEAVTYNVSSPYALIMSTPLVLLMDVHKIIYGIKRIQKCLQENKRNSEICNPDCKTVSNQYIIYRYIYLALKLVTVQVSVDILQAEVWIENNLGCCYRGLVDYDRAIGLAGTLN